MYFWILAGLALTLGFDALIAHQAGEYITHIFAQVTAVLPN